MSGLLQGFVWRAKFPVVEVFPSKRVNLNTATAKAVLARMADACHNSGAAIWNVARCLIAEDLEISADRVKKLQLAFARLGVLESGENQGGRGRLSFYQIDVERLVAFVPQERLPGRYKQCAEPAGDASSGQDAARETGARNRVPETPVNNKPGSRRVETGFPAPDKPGSWEPATNVKDTNDSLTNVSTCVDRGRSDEISEALRGYSALAQEIGLAVPRGTDRQRERLAKRLKADGIEDWAKALEKIRGSPFLQGEIGRGRWSGATLDWITDPDNFEKTLDGNYDRIAPNDNVAKESRYAAFIRRHQSPRKEFCDRGREPAYDRKRLAE